MPNPFSGIITSEFKTLFTNAIDALLEDSALTVDCELICRGTDPTMWGNVVDEAIGRKSANRYQSGGPIPFAAGSICTRCQGDGYLTEETTSTLYMMPIWDSRQGIVFSSLKKLLDEGAIKTPNTYVQTMSKFDSYENLTQASEVIIDTSIVGYTRNRFVIVGQPEICGFGASSYVLTMWKKAGSA